MAKRFVLISLAIFALPLIGLNLSTTSTGAKMALLSDLSSPQVDTICAYPGIKLWSDLGHPGEGGANRCEVTLPCSLKTMRALFYNYPGYYVPGIYVNFYVYHDGDADGPDAANTIYTSPPVALPGNSGWVFATIDGIDLLLSPGAYYFAYILSGDSATALTFMASDSCGSDPDENGFFTSDTGTTWQTNAVALSCSTRWAIGVYGKCCQDKMIIPDSVMAPPISPCRVRVPIYGRVCCDGLDAITFRADFDTSCLRCMGIDYEVTGTDPLGNDYTTLYDVIPTPAIFNVSCNYHQAYILCGLLASLTGSPDWPPDMYRFWDLIFEVADSIPAGHCCLLTISGPDSTYWMCGDTTIHPELDDGSVCKPVRFIRGDYDATTAVDMGDVIGLLNYLYSGFQPAFRCDDSYDANDDGWVGIADPMYLLLYLNNLGPSPPPPFPDCGTDSTNDNLGCDRFPPCNPEGLIPDFYSQSGNAIITQSGRKGQLNTPKEGDRLKFVPEGSAEPGDTLSVVVVAQAGTNPVEAVGIDELLYPECLTPFEVRYFGKAASADYHQWYYDTTGTPSLEGYDVLHLGVLFSFDCDNSKYLKPEEGEQSLAQIDFAVDEGATPGVYPISIPNHRAEFSVLGGSRDEPTIEVVDSVRVGIEPNGEVAALPKKFALFQNYPNPFNATTVIRYSLPVDHSSPTTLKGLAEEGSRATSRIYVRLEVYNILAQKVATLVDEKQTPGYKTVTWDAEGMASGIYFYRLKAGEFTAVRKMLLLK